MAKPVSWTSRSRRRGRRRLPDIYGKEASSPTILRRVTTAGSTDDRWKHCDVLINAGPYNMGYIKYARNSGETEPTDEQLCEDVQLIATALLETIG